MSDAPEIVTRPPSHPTATTLILASVFGTIAAIGFVWAELFTEYMPARAPGAPMDEIMSKHDPVAHANAPVPIHDHFAEDFGTGETLQAVEKDLGLASDVGSVPQNEPLPDEPAPPPADEGGGEGSGDVEAPDEGE